MQNDRCNKISDQRPVPCCGTITIDNGIHKKTEFTCLALRCDHLRESEQRVPTERTVQSHPNGSQSNSWYGYDGPVMTTVADGVSSPISAVSTVCHLVKKRG